MNLWLCEDSKEFSIAFSNLCAQIPQIESTSLYYSGELLLSATREKGAPQMALVDMRLPGISGIEVIQALQRYDQPPLCYAVTQYQSPELVHGAINAGASGYLLKDELARELPLLVSSIAHGKVWNPISSKVAGHLLPNRSTVTDNTSSPAPDLSPRERQVLTLMAGGLAVKEIADKQGVTHHTIDMQRRSIYAKLEAKNQTQAVAIAFRLRILSS